MADEIQVRDTDGNVIATIHDPEAFGLFLDNFEQVFQTYSVLVREKALGSGALFGANAQIDEQLKASAGQLADLRHQLGDERDLYPTQINRAWKK